MASLTVLKFSTSERAEEMPSKLQTLQNMHLIKNQEVAIVNWPERCPILGSPLKRPSTNR